MTKANEAPVPAISEREKEFNEAVQRIGEQFNWNLPAFFAAVKRDKETRNFAPATVARETELLPNWVLPMIRELARELYDRFVMGGWEPQDAYPQMVEIINRHWRAARASGTGQDAENAMYRQGRLDQFLRMKLHRPADPAYWDMYEEKSLREDLDCQAADALGVDAAVQEIMDHLGLVEQMAPCDGRDKALSPDECEGLRSILLRLVSLRTPAQGSETDLESFRRTYASNAERTHEIRVTRRTDAD